MDITQLSKVYRVARLTSEDVPYILSLCEGNPLYYKHCPPVVNRALIIEDMQALPPDKTLEDKYYMGFYEGEQLVAVMDLVSGYPTQEVTYVGFFMVASDVQGRGVGTAIIEACMAYLKDIGYQKARLGYVKGNLQAEHFWLKNRFVPIGREDKREAYTVVVMDRILV